MTVPFAPRVLPTARSQMGAGERFLDTATRAFSEAAGFIESQRENQRRQQEFESQQKLQELRSKALAQEIEIQSETRMRERASDPRFIQQGEPGAPPPASRVPEGQGFTPPYPNQPTGGAVPEEIARQLSPPGGLKELVPTRPGLRPTGVEGEFYDPMGEQRAAQEQMGQAGQQVKSLLDTLVSRYQTQGDTDAAQRLSELAPEVVTAVSAGANPAEAVQNALQDVRSGSQLRTRVQFLMDEVGRESIPPGLEGLPIEQQVKELERIRDEQTYLGRVRGRTNITGGSAGGGRTPARMTPASAAALLRGFNEIRDPYTGEVVGHRANAAQMLSLIDKLVAGTATPDDFRLFEDPEGPTPRAEPIVVTGTGGPLYAVDRIEGDKVVMIGDDGSEHVLPKGTIPGDVKEGSVYAVPQARGRPNWAGAVRSQRDEAARSKEGRARLDRMSQQDQSANTEGRIELDQQDYDDLLADGLTDEEIRSLYFVPSGVGGVSATISSGTGRVPNRR